MGNSLPALNRTLPVGHPICIEQGATILTDSYSVDSARPPTRADIESQVGLIAAVPAAMEKKAGIRQAENRCVPAGGCCCRLLCTLKRHAPRALTKTSSPLRRPP